MAHKTNEQNLIPLNKRSKEVQREIQEKGRQANAKKWQERKTMRDELKFLMSQDIDVKKKKGTQIVTEKKSTKEVVTLALIKEATKGNTKAYEIIRDGLGENPQYGEVTQQEREEQEQKQVICLPAIDVGRSFVDLNRLIDNREYTEYMLKGGRGSLKSSYISEKSIELLMNNPNLCMIAIRQVKDTLKDSVFSQLEWAIDKLSETYSNLKDDFKLTKSPMEITIKSTGQKIYFRGADDYGKIKSIKPPTGMYIGIIWYEEADQIKGGMESIRKINQSLERGGDYFYIFYTYNTPRSTQHFINQEANVPKPTRYVHLSDYRDVPAEWLGKPFIEEAEFQKNNNPKIYENEYLGIATGLGGNVFENLEEREITDDEIKTFDYDYQGMDFGWFPDPLAWTRCSFNREKRILYIYDELVVNKTSNEDVWKLLQTTKNVTNNDIIIADSAEPKSIGDFKAYGSNMRGAEKGPGSVIYSMKWLSALVKIVIDPVRCPHTAKEFREYEYEQDKDGNYISAYPDKNNHCIDSVRYGLNNIWKKKGE